MKRVSWNYKDMIVGYAVTLVLIAGTTALVFAARSFETHYFPVVEKMNVITHRFDGVDYVVTVWGDKVRDCEFIDDKERRILGYAVEDNVIHEATLTFLEDDTPGSSRPKGWQSFEEWHFSLKLAPNASEVFAVALHKCQEIFGIVLWETRTKVGPWPVIRESAEKAPD